MLELAATARPVKAALRASREQWLAPYLHGKHRLDALGAEALSQALASLFDHSQHQLLDAQAPEHVVVPSGQSRRLEYAGADSPVLAVKLQELFGLADTPRVGGGRIPVTLHLLSPAGRPIQVTQDLRGSWERTYPEVKKELKGRYPRPLARRPVDGAGHASGPAAGKVNIAVRKVLRRSQTYSRACPLLPS